MKFIIQTFYGLINTKLWSQGPRRPFNVKGVFILMLIGNIIMSASGYQHTNSWLVFLELSLTYWGRDKMPDVIFQLTFSNEFSWMKMYKFQLRFHWSFFPRVQLSKFQYWKIMAWHQPGDKPLSDPMLISLLMCRYVTWPQRVKNTCTISVLRNDRKCKYVLCFLEQIQHNRG